MKSATSNSEVLLAQFILFMEELFAGKLRRTQFRRWEIDLLLDIESSELRGSAKHKVLRDYRDAVQAELESGAIRVLRFTEYLQSQETGSVKRKPAVRAVRKRTRRKTGTH
jgi:hypothetical protein